MIIVGGGIAGVATAWGLGLLGRRQVLLLERETQLASHSTAKNASILRTHSHTPASTSLALETADFLVDPPPDFSEVALLDPVGLVLVPRRGESASYALWRERKAPGAVVELGESRLRELAPHYRGACGGAIWIRDEGHIDNSALIEGMLRGARRAGVRIRTGAQVRDFLRENGRVHGVELAGGERLEADIVVIASGGWAGPMARRCGSTLSFEARRRHLLVTAPQERVLRSWPILWSEEDEFYVRPESGGLMLCACDQDVVDPDHCEALPEVRERIARLCTDYLVGFDDAPAAHFWAGMRTFSDDEELAIGFDPDVGGLFWVAGLGGHGMSSSVGVGRHAARLLAGEATDEELRAALDPARFSGARQA